MCGRTCLTLSPNDICKACMYKTKNDDKYKEPDFRSEYNCGKSYVPSYNIAPTDVTPVLVSAAHFDDERPSSERILVPMMWSMIPFWHKGDYKKHGLTTNNCRLESIETSKLYKHALQKGQRCVIICEGFYEWQTTVKGAKSSERQPYFIYMPQLKSVDISKNETWNAEDVNLLKVAGLFDVWSDENGDTIYSYTVITFESDKHLSWLHHRSPAVLETEQQVSDWLDFQRVPYQDGIKQLRPPETLLHYQVSKLVNNSRNKSDQCNKPINSKVETVKPKRSMLDSWLNTKKSKLEK